MNISKIYITNTTTLSKNGQRPVNFTFDCVTDYSPVFKRAISTYPVSTKANFADHIFQENTSLKLVGMVTATPLQGNIENNTIDTEKGLARVQKAYDELLRLHKQSQPLVLVSEFDVLNNLYLTEVVPVQDNNAIMFTLSFEQQKFASYKAVTLVRNSLSADSATTNDGSGKGGKDGWGYSKEWGQDKKANPNGLKVVDPNSSNLDKIKTIFSNMSKVTKGLGDKLAADPVEIGLPK